MSFEEQSVSAVITFYDGGDVEVLEKSIESVAKQTVKPSEIVFILDGPVREDKDKKVRKVLAQAEESVRVRLIYEDVNRGPGGARDIAIRTVKSEFIAIVDSDDECLPERFELELKAFAQNSDLAVVGGVAEGENGKIRDVPKSHKDIVKCASFKSPFNNSTVMLRKGVYEKVGGYPWKRTSEDYELWARVLGEGYEACNIDQTFVKSGEDNGWNSRRQGLSVFLDDLKTQKTLKLVGIIGHTQYFRNVFLYFVFRMSPQFIMRFLYTRILRA